MKVIHVKTENVLGLREMEFEPGQVTVFQGKNALGKTSGVDAIQAVFSKQGLSEIRNLDATEDEPSRVILTLEDDNKRRYVAERNERGVTVTEPVIGDDGVVTAATKKVKRPGDFLAALMPIDAKLNPINIINAKDKERIDILLNALPVEFDEDDFWQTIGLNGGSYRHPPAHRHPLEKIAHYRREIFDRRTGVNVSMKEARNAANKIRKATPLEIPTVEGLSEKQESLAELRAQYATGTEKAKAKADADESAIRVGMRAAEGSAHTELASFKQVVYREADERIAAKQLEIAAQLQDTREQSRDRISSIRAQHASAQAEIELLRPQIEAVREELGKLESDIEHATRIQRDHEHIAEFESNAAECKIDSDKLTDALAKTDQYKSNMTKDLPIKGVDITDGNFTVDGVPWKMVNTGRKLEIAVAIICLRFGDAEFRPIFVDGAEALDSEAQEKLEQEVIKHGAQMFAARVTDDPEIKIRKVN